ncbi:transglycosylase domain-containing protein [Noviherbaspirillum sp. CPCC 100848]|uniref:Transglycosylase domain-containing protein n=1 Tax=Noviherbaspirillum album TaxID=3080276 RepID=A0ABU6JAG0_9BURK|nr:transglycosylase domain-containing protein [Noviherbaspirillum sp. CPCC 100848]MEC4720632.1 transglycosylase domain-containing protein [Noviherbaspirillum sp. CPCC 100848]
MVDNKSKPGPNPHQFPKPHPSAPRRILRRVVLIVTALVVTLLVATAVAISSYIAKIAPTTPGIEGLQAVREAQPSILLSADGTHLATFARGQQEQVTLAQISPNVIKALIATEDHRFYDHPGIDVSRSLSAIVHTLRGDAQGGSTITQQLVRNVFPEIGRSRTIERKVREIITAIKIEKAYGKDQILETYLNSVPFLYNVIGIEMAARTYYDKPAAELDVLESATLVGMLKGTSYYNPVLNPDRAQKRRNVVLAQMRKHGALSADEYDALREQPLQVKLTRQPDPLGSAPHFAGYVRRQMLEWADANDYNLYTDGLTIYSTLDDKLQSAAEASVERQTKVLQDIADVEWGSKSKRVASHTPAAYAALRKKVEPFSYFWTERADLLDAFIRETGEYKKAVAAGRSEEEALAGLKANEKFMTRLREGKTRLEAGFLAMDPVSGEVKAWVGSRDFEIDQFDHVAQAERQPGSTFKPIVYGAALEQGLRPDRIYPDGQVEIRLVDGGVWRPTDMSGFSNRMMSMREGLVYSKNTITAQVMQDVGLPNVLRMARAVGIEHSRLDPVPSLSLGTSPVTLFEMVSAYSTIARVGEYRKPVVVRKIADRHGNVIAEFGSEPQRVMSEETAIELIDMMRGVVRFGTGTEVRSRFNIAADIAGKTGTTQNNTDGWFIMMHPRMVAGAWVGFNDSRVTMRSDHWGQGGHNALLLVGDFFRDTLKAKLVDTKIKFPQPKRPPPLIVQEPSQEWVDRVTENMELTPPPGYGVIQQNGTTVVVGPAGQDLPAERAPSPSSGSSQGEDEAGRYLTDSGRRPALSGIPVESSGSTPAGTWNAGGGDLNYPVPGQ